MKHAAHIAAAAAAILILAVTADLIATAIARWYVARKWTKRP